MKYNIMRGMCMNTIKITKMQGCGNDFIILDYEEYKKTNLEMPELAKKICNRNFGVGADGLIIPKTDSENADIGWYFYNSAYIDINFYFINKFISFAFLIDVNV